MQKSPVYSFFYHWLEADLNLADKAEDLISQLKDTKKRSYVLAKTREANPIGLGASLKEHPEPGNESNNIRRGKCTSV